MLKTGLQKLVLSLNQVPFALHVTRLPYYAAIKACQRLMARHPGIHAAYARNSFALGTWVPGRSDIDITALWHSHPSNANPDGMTELAAIAAWWRDYAKLQRLYPMLGEVEMIHKDHLLASTRFGLTGFEARQWLPIYGESPPQSGYSGNAAQQKRDRFSYALSVYHHQMRSAVKLASKMTLRRYAKKIWRYLDLPMDPAMESKLRQSSAIEIQVLVIQALAQRAVIEVSALKTGKPVHLETLLKNDSINQIESSSLPENHPVLRVLDQPARAMDLVSVFPASNYPNKTYYMVRDDISEASLTAYLLALQGRAEDAMVMPQSLLTCLFYMVDIFEYLALVSRRTTLWGKDPFTDWPSLAQSDFNVALGTSAGYVFSLPYQADFTDCSEQTFKNFLLGWILRIGRFLEDGVMDLNYERLNTYWLQKHPDIIGSSDLLPPDIQGRFDLLCRLNQHISQGLLRLNR